MSKSESDQSSSAAVTNLGNLGMAAAAHDTKLSGLVVGLLTDFFDNMITGSNPGEQDPWTLVFFAENVIQ